MAATPTGAANLNTEERMAALLDAALEDGHPQVIAAALGAIARSQGMAKIAKDTGLTPNRAGRLPFSDYRRVSA